MNYLPLKQGSGHHYARLAHLTLVTVFILLLASCSKKINQSEPQQQALAPSTDVSAAATPYHNSQVLFDGGTNGYHSYRIPSIVRTKNGTLVAFAEGRRWNNSDWGDINLIYKRSTDNGTTWSALMEVVGAGNGTWGNPTAVYDWNKGTNGRIWLFMNWHAGHHTSISSIDTGDRKIYTSYSDDHGLTWSAPLDRTSTLTPPTFTWDAVGPGIGIQTVNANAGRLVIPAKGRNIYSDNNGTTWQYQLVANGTDEGTIVETMDGRLMRNDRPGTGLWNTSKRRRVAYGTIGSAFPSWSIEDELPDPKCEGSVIRYNGDNPNRIFFLNPNSISQRCNMTIRISYDDGLTWPRSRAIFDYNTCSYSSLTIGRGGYSSMIKTADYAVGALIEINENLHDSLSRRSIEFHKFNLPWILNGVAE